MVHTFCSHGDNSNRGFECKIEEGSSQWNRSMPIANRAVRLPGVFLTLAILAGLLIVPIPASAGVLSWTTVSTPSTTGNVLVAGSPSWMMDVAPDGTTIFAYDNVGLKLYKSTNDGSTFSTSGIGSFFTELGVPFSTS